MTATKEKKQSPPPSNVSNMTRSGRALLPPTYHVGMADQPIMQAQLMSGPFIQSKLTVNQPGDVYEREADAVADKVMGMPTPSVNTEKMQLKPMPFSQISRKCAACEKEEENKDVHRKESGHSVGGQIAPPIVSDVIGSNGQPLDNGTRQFMESRMGHDFGNVQVHTGGKAAESAAAVNALAYTSGNHIVFNSGQYAPDTEGGKRLLAHELTHVVQQGKEIRRQATSAALPGRDRASCVAQITEDVAGCCDTVNTACSLLGAGIAGSGALGGALIGGPIGAGIGGIAGTMYGALEYGRCVERENRGCREAGNRSIAQCNERFPN